MSDAVEEFGEQILLRWPPPRTWTAEKTGAWGADLHDQLGQQPKEVLDLALKFLIREHAYASTPAAADVIKIVSRASKEIAARRQSEQLNLQGGGAFGGTRFGEKPEHRAWSPDHVKLAYQLLRTESGRRAAREGWVAQLWHYIVTYGQAPSETEIEGLKRSAREFNEDYEQLAKGTGPLLRSLYEIAQKKASDAQRLADYANGKDVPTREDYFSKVFMGGLAKMKASPPSKYADENEAEGRGLQGRTA